MLVEIETGVFGSFFSPERGNIAYSNDNGWIGGYAVRHIDVHAQAGWIVAEACYLGKRCTADDGGSCTEAHHEGDEEGKQEHGASGVENCDRLGTGVGWLRDILLESGLGMSTLYTYRTAPHERNLSFFYHTQHVIMNPMEFNCPNIIPRCMLLCNMR